MDKHPDLQRALLEAYEAQKSQLDAQTQLITQMQEQAAAQDKSYQDLISQLTNLGILSSSLLTSSKQKKGKARTSTQSIPPQTSQKIAFVNKVPPKTMSNKIASTSKSQPFQPQASTSKSTPQKQTAKKSPSLTPQAAKASNTKVSPTSTPKRDPHQFKVVEMPSGFENTKECLFLLFRILWGLNDASSVPHMPDPNLMAEFNA
ncbi:hypothetical protein CROQUDRAFT_102383 [Cronartium quercuum f. sp. fusiforme G11]|uniref:Uncharacterized protein n=1 Tax=Cronartium quercuum f. sp. fusiforme G11 TaxID=708437 RepID=A0A9P6T583_9BASI|nr:hypothetical protein CROQUDRAFT_102383 [Cronartium quercuum f. sp. fusiforme G11]